MFSRRPVVVEAVDKLYSNVQSGSWAKDTAGGSLRIMTDGQHRENHKWCQNPQYHFNLVNIFNKDELHLKVVVRRTDLNPTIKVQDSLKILHQLIYILQMTAEKSNGDDANLGMTICKAEYFYDAEEMAIRNKGKSVLKGKPRENAMGEVTMARRFNLSHTH